MVPNVPIVTLICLLFVLDAQYHMISQYFVEVYDLQVYLDDSSVRVSFLFPSSCPLMISIGATSFIRMIVSRRSLIINVLHVESIYSLISCFSALISLSSASTTWSPSRYCLDYCCSQFCLSLSIGRYLAAVLSGAESINWLASPGFCPGNPDLLFGPLGCRWSLYSLRSFQFLVPLAIYPLQFLHISFTFTLLLVF